MQRWAIFWVVFIAGCSAIADPASAQRTKQVVVTVPTANLRAEPSATSAVVAQVPKGTVLEVVEERGLWLKVRYRHLQRGLVEGWVAARLVEPVAEPAPPPGPPEKPAPPPPPEKAPPRPPPPPRPTPPQARPAAREAPSGFLSVRLLLGINPGVADGYDQMLTDQLQVYFEPVPLNGAYKAKLAPVFGLGLEYRLRPQVAVGIEGDLMMGKTSVDFTAEVPHPLYFNNPRSVRASADGFRYQRLGGTVYATWYLRPQAAGLGLSLSVGGTIHFLQFESIAGMTLQEQGYPYDKPPTVGVVKEQKSGTLFGGWLGVGLHYRLSPRADLDFQPRVLVSTGSPSGPLGEEIQPKALSFWVLAALRYRL